jgi:hypothetical protein
MVRPQLPRMVKPEKGCSSSQLDRWKDEEKSISKFSSHHISELDKKNPESEDN